MNIQRQSTVHDLATLRLHPDGSRVQQSSVSAKQRTAKYTVVDARGNWIAQDAGGQGSVQKRRRVSVAVDDDQDCERIILSPDGHGSDEGDNRLRRRRHKRKQRDVSSDVERERLDTRRKCRLSFTEDLSFLDPPVEFVSEPQDGISFAPPASELLKSIHHFTACYYRERGLLSDCNRLYRKAKKNGRHDVHTLSADTPKGVPLGTDQEDMWEDEEQESSDDDTEGDERDVFGGGTSSDDPVMKSMYKAFDGSALVAIGILLQEQIAHLLASPSEASIHLGCNE